MDAEGLTLRLPEDATVPTPLSITTLVASEELHERVVEFPLTIAVGEALNEMVGAGISGFGGGGGGSSFTGAGGGGVTFLAHPIPVISKAAVINAKETSVVVDLRMRHLLLLGSNSIRNCNDSITTESGAVYHVPESVKTKQAKKLIICAYTPPMRDLCCRPFA